VAGDSEENSLPELVDDVLAHLTAVYIETAGDRLDAIDRGIDNIFHGRGDRGVQYFELQNEIHSLKGSAGSYGFSLITAIAHRLEDYMESTRRLENDQWLDVQAYIDAVRDIIARGRDPDQAKHHGILKNLPSSSANDGSEAGQELITVLLVMDSGVQRKFVGTELAANGIDVAFADNLLEALNPIAKIKPDAVFCSQEFADYSGADLANMLSVQALGKALKFAILTSTETLTAVDLGVPYGVGIIHKNSQISENILAFLDLTGGAVQTR
jgi:HPt (histidine-containing phosphotransfer) domain-containing protein/CheY-like chemotaxis protein